MSLMGTVERGVSAYNQIEEAVLAYWAWVFAFSIQLANGSSQAIFGDLLSADQHANVDMIITVVVIAVVAIVGILIYANVEETINVEHDALSSSADEVTTGFGDAMELVPIVLIVLVAAVVIGVIARFRRVR